MQFILCLFLLLFFPLEGTETLYRELLITGCARSGTAYIAKALQQAGLDIQHEQIGKNGSSSWVMAVPSEETPWGPSRKNVHFAHIFHQVRNPLDVIASVYTTEGPKSWGYIMEHIPEILPEDPYLVRSAKYWYYWNLKAKKIAEFTYQLEKIEEVWLEFEKRLGKQLASSHLKSLSKSVNSRDLKPPRSNFDKNLGKAAFTWEDLRRELDPILYENLCTLAKKYGYLSE